MSRATVNDILDRTLVDEEFRAAVEADPDAFLADYDLTDEERAALISRDFKKTNEITHGPNAGLTFVRVFVTTTNNNNLVAIRSTPDDSLKVELTRRGAEIAEMPGDRVEPIKELLAQMR